MKRAPSWMPRASSADVETIHRKRHGCKHALLRREDALETPAAEDLRRQSGTKGVLAGTERQLVKRRHHEPPGNLPLAGAPLLRQRHVPGPPGWLAAD